MTRSHVWKCAGGLLAVIGLLALRPGLTQAQAPSTSKFPDSVTVSSGPKTNLFDHVMKKADILAALAQVQDSRDLFVKSNAALTLRAANNTSKLPFKLHPEADELWFV